MTRAGKGDWKADLDFGKKAEMDFSLGYHQPIVPSSNLKWDFVSVSEGKRIELKTDDYEHSKTPNFFLERYSDVHKETPGGPWRARKHGVHVFCYYFIRDGIYYEFKNVKEMCKVADKYVKDKKLGLVYIKNRAWITGGYKIPRELLEDVMTKHEIRGVSK